MYSEISIRRGRDRDRDLGGACQYSRRGLRLRRRGAYGIHRASGPRCQGLCSLRSRGPPIGGQENDRVSYLCSAPYTLLPLRGISPQGETRNLRRKTERHILHVPLRHSPLWWLAPPPSPRSSVGRQKESALMGRLCALLRPCGGPMQDLHRGRITRAYRSTTYEWNKIDNQHESKEL